MTVEIATCFGQAAHQYDGHAHVQQRAANVLLSRAGDANGWLDLGCGTGYVAKRLPGSVLATVDIALPMLQVARQQQTPGAVICADMHQLPFADNRFGGVCANLSLQWSYDLPQTLAEMARIAHKGAKLLATLPLASTFPQLHQLRQQDLIACNRFPELAGLQTFLEESPWQRFELRPFTETIYYPTAKALLSHFKATGTHHSPTRGSGLRGRAWWHQVEQTLEQYRTAQGIPLTWELVLIEAVLVEAVLIEAVK